MQNATPQQLRMIWPEARLAAAPPVQLHPDYLLRTYQPGDEEHWFQLMDKAGFDGWNQVRLEPLLAAVLPEGWFLAVDRASGHIVATAMAVHRPHPLHPFGGELSWVAADPAHAGKGLGWTVCAAVTGRFLSAGYRTIYLLTDDVRLPALRIYLKLGYLPLLYAPDMAGRWQQICAHLGWPFTPEQWPQPTAP